MYRLAPQLAHIRKYTQAPMKPDMFDPMQGSMAKLIEPSQTNWEQHISCAQEVRGKGPGRAHPLSSM